MLTMIAEQFEQNSIEKGIELSIEKVARSLLQQGVDLNIIMQCIGLTWEKIESLKH